MNYQFFPTGVHTAAVMWSKFKRPIRHLCDPSAGKGHLIRHARSGFEGLNDEEIPWVTAIEDQVIGSGKYAQRLRELARGRYDTLREVSVIEIDLQHHSSLKELGAKVIGYDFLEVNSLATVSHIIMNPPFADGAKHVLHAWNVVYDAEIVAIINAESIKNPFSKERQILCELIAQHGTVEFLQSQFVDDVERTTDVEVALIYLDKVPSKYFDVDSLMGDLRKGDNRMSEIDPEVCTALALPSNFIHDTYYRFEEAVEAARKSCEAEAVVNHLTESLGVTLEEMQAKGVGNDFRKSAGDIREAANKAFKARYDDLKKRAWAQIIRSSLITDRLSNQARLKIEASSQEIYDLEFTIGNVHGFLAGVISSMGTIYSDMIVDLFDTIIERSTDNVVFHKSWNSNQKHRIGVRIRKSRFIIPRFKMSSFAGSLDYECSQLLADIDKVFGYLHGITGPYEGLANAFMTKDIVAGERYSTEYFDFRFFRGTQTIHFFPKSESVVEKINLFVGKRRQWIPGDMSEANADFRTQYEKGESFTKEYLDAYKKANRNACGNDRPANRLLREIRGQEAEGIELNLLEAAIEAVHDKAGLHCGVALAGSAKEKALGAPQTGQMLLLAA